MSAKGMRKIIVSEEDRLEQADLLAQHVSWGNMLSTAVVTIVEGQTKVKLKMQRLWVRLRAKYNLDPNTNYNMNDRTGEIEVRTPKKPSVASAESKPKDS